MSDKRWAKDTEIREYPPGKPVEFRRKDGSLIATVQIGRSHSLTTTLRREDSNQDRDPASSPKEGQ